MNQALEADSTPWRLYICIACGLIYNEEEGDPDSGLAPGTRFEDIPDDWECPDCGVTKSDFKPFVKRTLEAKSPPQKRAKTGLVIIGAGMAGWAMVEAVREQDTSTAITLITSCDGHRYNKPQLSASFSRDLQGILSLIQEDAYEAAQRLGVTLVERTFVISVSPATKKIRTTRGGFSFTKLIIAQGSQTALPAALPEHLCWRINRLNDWQALNRKLGNRPVRIAVVGAGMVGCEIAEDLCRAGHSVYLISRHERPLNGTLPVQACIRLQDSLQKIGITFVASAHIHNISESDNGTKVAHWGDNETLEVDEVVATTGVVTASRIAKSAGIAFDQGIVVNPQTLATSAKDIYAVGDCISINGMTDRYIEPIEHQVSVVADAISANPTGLKYQHKISTVALKIKSLPIVLHGRPIADVAWNEVRSDSQYLLMEQRKHGDLMASLTVGTARQ